MLNAFRIHGKTVAAIATLGAATLAPSIAHADLAKGLVASYCFETNATTDCSGKKNTGTAFGDVTLVAGRYGRGVRFGGFQSLGYIRVPNSKSLTLNKQFTIAYWVKLDTFAGEDAYHNAVPYATQIAVAKSHDRAGLFTYVGASSDTTGAIGMINYGAALNLAEAIEPRLGEWIHVAFTAQATSGKLQIYINGRLRELGTAPSVDLSTFSTQDLYLGAQAPLFGTNVYQYPLAGTLDEVRIYSRVLTADEIAALFGTDACDVLPSATP